MEGSMHAYTAVFFILAKLDQEENQELFITKRQSMMCATIKNFNRKFVWRAEHIL